MSRRNFQSQSARREIRVTARFARYETAAEAYEEALGPASCDPKMRAVRWLYWVSLPLGVVSQAGKRSGGMSPSFEAHIMGALLGVSD